MKTCRKKICSFVTALVAVATVSLAQAVTYYVATDGDDANGGSNPSTDALASLEKAIELAQDADSILVGEGTYYLQAYTGLTITNAIHMKRANEADTVIIKPKVAESGYTGTRRLLIVNSSDAVVDGLTLAGPHPKRFLVG